MFNSVLWKLNDTDLEKVVKNRKKNNIMYNKGIFGGVFMIWLYMLIPVFIIGGIAIYFEKKSGMTTPNELKQAEMLGEVTQQNGINTSGAGTNY